MWRQPRLPVASELKHHIDNIHLAHTLQRHLLIKFYLLILLLHQEIYWYCTVDTHTVLYTGKGYCVRYSYWSLGGMLISLHKAMSL